MLFEFCGRAGGAELRRRGAATQPVAPFNVDGIPGEINGNFLARKTVGFQAPGNIEGGDLLRCGSSRPICMKIKFPIIYTAGGRVEFGRTELSLSAIGTTFCALSSGHGPRNP